MAATFTAPAELNEDHVIARPSARIAERGVQTPATHKSAQNATLNELIGRAFPLRAYQADYQPHRLASLARNLQVTRNGLSRRSSCANRVTAPGRQYAAGERELSRSGLNTIGDV